NYSCEPADFGPRHRLVARPARGPGLQLPRRCTRTWLSPNTPERRRVQPPLSRRCVARRFMPIARSAMHSGKRIAAFRSGSGSCDIVFEGSAIVVWMSSARLRRKAHELGSRYDLASLMPNRATYIVRLGAHSAPEKSFST